MEPQQPGHASWCSHGYLLLASQQQGCLYSPRAVMGTLTLRVIKLFKYKWTKSCLSLTSKKLFYLLACPTAACSKLILKDPHFFWSCNCSPLHLVQCWC